MNMLMNAIDERLRSIDKERQLLHLLINHQDQQLSILDDIRNRHFAHVDTSEIFGYVSELYVNDRDINYDSVQSIIKLRSTPNRIDPLISEFFHIAGTQVVASEDNLKADLEEMYKNRVVYQGIIISGSRMFTANTPIEEIIGHMSDALLSIETGRKELQTKDVAMNTAYEITNPEDGEQGLFIGINDIDRQFGGFIKDRYWTIGAESGCGKTATVTDFIERLCSRHADKIAICFFSCEMSEKRVVKRLISRKTGFSIQKMSQQFKELTQDEKDQVLDAAKLIKDYPLQIIYGSTDAQKMKMRARKFALKNRGKHLFFILDHIGKVEGSGNDMRVRTIESSACMKSFCMDYDATSIVLTQFKKEITSRERAKTYHKPDLSDIMESGAIQADSDNVILLWRPDMRFDTIEYNGDPEWDCQGKMIYLNEKNRDGQSPTHMVLDHDIKSNLFKNPANPFV